MNNRQLKETKFWDKFANKYDAFVNNAVSKTYKEIINNLISELKITDNILEIGTGTGIISFSIHTKVASIKATDISPEMIKVAKQKQSDSHIKNIDFEVQDSYNMTFPDKSFDIVIASNLLHLLYEPEKPISEVKRVMKNSGIFIAPTFCVGEDFKSRTITSIAGFFSGFKVVNKWSINGFKDMLTNNGFVIDKLIRIDGRFPLAFVVMKLKN